MSLQNLQLLDVVYTRVLISKYECVFYIFLLRKSKSNVWVVHITRRREATANLEFGSRAEATQGDGKLTRMMVLQQLATFILHFTFSLRPIHHHFIFIQVLSHLRKGKGNKWAIHKLILLGIACKYVEFEGKKWEASTIIIYSMCVIIIIHIVLLHLSIPSLCHFLPVS